MGAAQVPGPLAVGDNKPVIDTGTTPRMAMPLPAPTGLATTPPPAAAAVTEDTPDPQIDALDLAVTARTAAYALKKAHPSVKFTSGRRDKADQADAMASNVVKNRKWIEQTYAKSDLRTKCQDWIDKNTDKTKAFDVQPVDKDAEAIKKTIRGLTGLDKFLDTEGGLVRWHAQF